MRKTNRITIRLTDEMIKRIDKIMESGKYLNRSDLIRDLIWSGFKNEE